MFATLFKCFLVASVSVSTFAAAKVAEAAEKLKKAVGNFSSLIVA